MLKLIFLLASQAVVLIAASFTNKIPVKEMVMEACNVLPACNSSIIQGGSYLRCLINRKDWIATGIVPDKYVLDIVQIQAIQGTNKKTFLWASVKQTSSW